MVFFNEKNQKKTDDSWHKKLIDRDKFWLFLTPPHYTNSQNSIISFRYVNLKKKIFLIFGPSLGNSTTRTTIIIVVHVGGGGASLTIGPCLCGWGAVPLPGVLCVLSSLYLSYHGLGRDLGMGPKGDPLPYHGKLWVLWTVARERIPVGKHVFSVSETGLGYRP